MITLRKLSSLKYGTRIRKYALVCREISENTLSGITPDFIYLHGLGALISGDDLPENLKVMGRELELVDPATPFPELGRLLDNLHFNILRHLGITPGDWDLKTPGGNLDSDRRIIRPFRVYLDDLRSPFNVGSVFRTSDAFGVEKILLSESTPGPDHPRAERTAMGCGKVIPWERGGLDLLEDEPAVFALELGGDDIGEFKFPDSGVVIIGSEETGLSPSAQALVSRREGRVSIPMSGAKGSINVSVAFGILMYMWNTSVSNK